MPAVVVITCFNTVVVFILFWVLALLQLLHTLVQDDKLRLWFFCSFKCNENVHLYWTDLRAINVFICKGLLCF